MTRRTAITILPTQNKKLMSPILAPWPHGNQTLVPSAAATSTTRITIACAVPLFWPNPMVTPKAILIAKRVHANSWEPCL